MPPLKRVYSVDEIYDSIMLDRPRNYKINLSEVSTSYNNLLNIMMNKENILMIQYYPLHDQIQKLQNIQLEEILLLFWIMGCQITIQEAYKKIEITFPQYDFPSKTQEEPYMTQRERIIQSKYSLLSLFKHLLQQPQYQKQQFQLEQLYSDLFLAPSVLSQNYQDVDGIFERGKQNEQITQLNEFRKQKIHINQYDVSRLQKQVDKYLKSEQSITQYNLIRDSDTGLYQVANPYNLTSQDELRATLQKYVVKKNELTQFIRDVDSLNKLVVYFVLNKQKVTLDLSQDRGIEIVSFNLDRLKEEYLQIRRPFCFSTQHGQAKKQEITPTLRQSMLNQITFQKSKSVTIERQNDIGTAVSSKSTKWLNHHISAPWYLEKKQRSLQPMQSTHGENSESSNDI